MKKNYVFLFIVVAMMVSSCANSKHIRMPIEKQIDGKTYVIDTTVNVKPYGLFNQEKKKIEGVEYKLVVGNVIWSVILIETIGVPIYFIGWRLFEPVGLESDKIKIAK